MSKGIQASDIEKTLVELLPRLKKDIDMMIYHLHCTSADVDSIIKKDVKYK